MKLPRLIPAALVSAVLAFSVAACGSDDSSDTADTTGTAASESGTAASESASWPVTVEHALGSTTVDEKPERIVVMHEAGIDPVLSLGLEPVAMFEIQGGDDNMPWLKDRIDWPEDAALTADRTADPEAIASYDPDLIIVGDVYVDDAKYQELGKIAPTLVYGWPADGPAWQPILDGVATATGLEDKAAEVKQRYNDRIAAIQAQFPGIDKLTYNSAIMNQGQLMYTTNSVFEDLGMVQTDAQKAAGARGTISLERLDELDGDVLVIYDPSGDKKILEDNAQFAALPSVKNGSLIWQDMALGYAVTTASGPLSLDWAVEHITPELTAAVK
ncbi:ABC transporter substrate-binding protein [Corynebacterium variabile]|uniref:Iron-siderophore binding protein n=1 Tax=Corynebacterium variabile (strain DSM 44702 / CIP 107183 / JCM 12073 / NCIMB 30131) TaxID=858619 RepID=G0HAA8_CORVD|nr:ABC transporter substrate-binding protein [Corynebacterium variabile]AEK36124.1 iron-siderophore binding protein [Corynebacterium variabile DSM 44702]